MCDMQDTLHAHRGALDRVSEVSVKEKTIKKEAVILESEADMRQGSECSGTNLRRSSSGSSHYRRGVWCGISSSPV